MSDMLRHELARIAEEMRIVDLEPDVRRTSRRMAFRRTVALTAVAVVVVGAGVGTVLALRPFNQGVPVPPATDGPTSTAVPTTPTTPTGPAPTSPAPTVQTDATLVGCANVPPPAGPVGNLPGRFYAMTWRDSDGCVLVVEYGPTGSRTVLAVPDPKKYFAVANSITVSPDGRKAAWVCCNTAEDDLRGDLVVAAIDGTGAHKVTTDVLHGDRDGWQPDSRYLVVSRNQEPARVDTTTDAIQPATVPGSFLVWSRNGQYRAYLDGSDAIVVTGANGNEIRRTKDYGDPTGCQCGISLQGLTDDGRYVIVSHRPTDPGRALGGRTVLDTRTGKVVKVATPPAGADVTQVLPAPGGGFVVLSVRPATADAPSPPATTLHLVSADLVETGRQPVSIDGIVLRYVP